MEYLVLKKAVGEDVVLTKTVPYRQLIKADQKCELLGVETFTISVETTEPINFQIGDYIRAFKRRYWVNDPKNISVSDLGDKLVYDVQLEGIQYRFLNAVLLDMGTSDFATGTDVALVGTLKEIISIIVASVNFNENREMIVVDMNSIPETKRMQISFSDTNCLAALQTVCSDDYFKMVFKFVEKIAENENNYQYELKIGETVGIDRPYIFSVGDVGGTYDIKRVKTDNAGSMFTRLFAFGSSDNIPTNYRNYSAKLRLPTTISGAVYLPSNIELIDDENKNLTYIQLKNVKQHISKSITYSDIKPHRTGVVTDVEADSVFKFFDADIDFDINEKKENGDSKYLLGGESAKIYFNTGKLAGLEFEFTYITNQKAFVLKSFKDENGRQFPDPDSTAFRVSPGDEYVILNINMPDEYIEDAENELLSASIKDLQDSLKVVNKFTLRIKELYLKKQQIGDELNNFFEVGDFVSVKDKTMEDAKRIQVLSFSRSYLTPYAYTVDLSDTITLDYLTQVLGDINSLQEVVVNNKLDDPARTKRNWMATVELVAMIDTVKAEALLIGNDPAAQYNMSQTIVRTNYQSNENRIVITASVIQHNCYPLSSPGGIWNVMYADIAGLSPTSPLYVYIKANIDNNIAMYYFSLTKLAVDLMPGVYLFPFGILSSVIDGARVFTTTKGFTLITGDNIRTGKIESPDGLTYFDLNNGEIGGNIKFKSGQTPEDLEADIENLYAEIAGFGADGIITPAEKRELKIQWDEIAYEFQDLYDQGDALNCASFEVYGDAYSALYSYLFINPNLLNPANMGIESTIVPSDYKLVWANYLKFRAALRTEIAASINMLVDIAISDGVLTPAEKLQLKSMWDGMVADHGKVVRRATAAGITALTVYTTFVSKYNTLVAYLNPIFANMSANSTIVPATFKTNFSYYATAKAEVEKYLDEYDEQTIASMIANIDKAISDSWVTPSEQRTLRIQWETIEGEIGTLYNQANNLGCASTSNYYTAYTTLRNYIGSIGLFVNMSASVYIANVTTFRAYWIAYYQYKEIIVMQINDKLGIKASAADYLRTAMQGSTDITGGLLLTNLLLMKSTSGLIQGGMSGILADIIGMWTGGTYEQAQAGTANVILYKNGTAKIGIFKVYADRIEVDLPYGKLKFDGTGLYLLDANSNKKVEIYSGNIPTLASIVGDGSQLSVPAQSLNATFVNETVLTNFGGQFSLAKASNKITMNVSATIKFTFAGSNVELYWRIRNTGTNEIIMWGSPIIYYAGELNTTKNISLSTSIYDKPAGTYQLELRIYTGGGTSFTYNRLEIASGYVNYQVISPRTIIGANGMASIYSNSEYFHVEKNVGDKMRIRLSGDVQINGTNY